MNVPVLYGRVSQEQLNFTMHKSCSAAVLQPGQLCSAVSHGPTVPYPMLRPVISIERPVAPRSPQEARPHWPRILWELIGGGFPPDVSEHRPAQEQSQPCSRPLQQTHTTLPSMQAGVRRCLPVKPASAGAALREALAQAHGAGLSVRPLALPPDDAVAVAQRTPGHQSTALWLLTC